MRLMLMLMLTLALALIGCSQDIEEVTAEITDTVTVTPTDTDLDPDLVSCWCEGADRECCSYGWWPYVYWECHFPSRWPCTLYCPLGPC